jgi:hypothetical protein
MSEAINMHKRIAMGGESEANHLKKGGKVKRYAKGGSVKNDSIDGSDSGQPAEMTHQRNVNKISAYPEKVVAKLPAKGVTPKITKAMPHSIATMKKGGKAKGGLSVMVAVAKPMRKAVGRGR